MTGVRRRAVVIGVAIALGLATCASAADWPQFLGTQRDGVAHDAKGLARSWPATGPTRLWETPVGLGYGGAAIYGDSVFLLDREGDERDVLRRISLATGQDVWRSPYDAPGKADHNGGRSTPATDGNLVFTVGMHGQVRAVKFSDGSFVWQRDLLKEWEAQKPNWAVSESPLLYGNGVIVMPWGKRGSVVALDKATGNTIWTAPNPRGVGQHYTSPTGMTLGGQDIVLAMGERGYLMGVDAKTGAPLWEYDGFPKTGNNIPTPLPIGDGRVFLTSGYGAGCVMIRVEGQGGQFGVTELFKNKNMGSSCAQALLWDGYIYGNSSDTGGGLRCLTLDGEVKWDSRTGGGPTFDRGSLLIADGLIYAINGANGAIFMAEATPEGYKQLGKAPLLAPPEVWAQMAFKDGRLIVRDMHKMVCLDLTAAQ